MSVGRKFCALSAWVSLSLLGTLAGSARIAAAHNPAVGLDPTSGPVGTVVMVAVTGFDPDRDAEVFWNQEEIGAFHIGADGSGSLSFPVPGGAPPGNHQVLVLCMTCQPPIGERANAWFEVIASEVTPTPTTADVPTATHTALPPTLPPSPTTTNTPPLTCERAGNCTATPTVTTIPTTTPAVAPSSIPSATDSPSPTPFATATPTRAAVTAPPRPSATTSASPTLGSTATALISPSPTPRVEPTQAKLPVLAATLSATATVTPPPPTLTTPATPTLMLSPAPGPDDGETGSVFAVLIILLGGLVIVLGGFLSGLIRWPFRRGR